MMESCHAGVRAERIRRASSITKDLLIRGLQYQKEMNLGCVPRVLTQGSRPSWSHHAGLEHSHIVAIHRIHLKLQKQKMRKTPSDHRALVLLKDKRYGKYLPTWQRRMASTRR